MSDLDRKAIAILRGALDTDPASLDAYISQHCETDPVLAERVRALLSKVRGNEGTELVDPAGLTRVGTIVAQRYRLLERIGVGGMGEVYRAERVDGDFRQEVALKRVHGGFAGLIDRFGRERQILARLTHPNIAHLIDGGVDGDGTPWLAMEYVDGERITNWCDARQLRPGARVDLMLRICDAIGFAHRNLVVHRDIKPANVLVANDGTPKLLDFGIARLLDAGDAGATQTLAMTPAYAAPEQRRGEAVTTATDVYQLGLVLYELLAGISRHQAGQHGRAASTDSREQPSMARAYDALAADDAMEAMRIARARDLSPERLRVMLKGDLGRIIGKALSDAPADRYGSARELADDLQRWRSDRPILARRESKAYRVAKFIRRHRAAAVFAGVAVLSLSTAVVGMAWKTAEASREAERANAVQDYLIDVFEASVPGAPTDQLPGTRELLEHGRDIALANTLEDLDTQAAMLTAIARIHRQLGLYTEARTLIERALAIRERLFGVEHRLYLDSLFEFGEVLRKSETLSEARPVLEQSLMLALAQASEAELEGDIRRSLGTVLSLQRDHARAEALLRAALTLHDQTAPASINALATLQALALAIDRAGRPDEAAMLYQQALERARTIHGPVHAEVASLLANYGALLRPHGRYADAERVLAEAVAIDAQVYPEPHPEHALHLRNLATAQAYQGRHDDAERSMRQSLALIEAIHGADSIDAGKSAINLGAIQIEQRKHALALDTLRGGLAIFEASSEDYRVEIAVLNINIGRALRELRRWPEAEAALQRAIALRTALYGDDHADTAHAIAVLGVTLRARGDLPRSEALLRRALQVTAGALPPTHPRLAQRHGDLAETLRLAGRHSEAIAQFQESLRIGLAAGLQSGHAQLLESRIGLALSLIATGKSDTARVQAEQIGPAIAGAFAEGDPAWASWSTIRQILGLPPD